MKREKEKKKKLYMNTFNFPSSLSLWVCRVEGRRGRPPASLRQPPRPPTMGLTPAPLHHCIHFGKVGDPCGGAPATLLSFQILLNH